MGAKPKVLHSQILVMNLLTHCNPGLYWLTYRRLTPVFLRSFHSLFNKKKKPELFEYRIQLINENAPLPLYRKIYPLDINQVDK